MATGHPEENTPINPIKPTKILIGRGFKIQDAPKSFQGILNLESRPD